MSFYTPYHYGPQSIWEAKRDIYFSKHEWPLRKGERIEIGSLLEDAGQFVIYLNTVARPTRFLRDRTETKEPGQLWFNWEMITLERLLEEFIYIEQPEPVIYRFAWDVCYLSRGDFLLRIRTYNLTYNSSCVQYRADGETEVAIRPAIDVMSILRDNDIDLGADGIFDANIAKLLVPCVGLAIFGRDDPHQPVQADILCRTNQATLPVKVELFHDEEELVRVKMASNAFCIVNTLPSGENAREA